MIYSRSIQFFISTLFLLIFSGCMAQTDTPDVIIEKARLCELDEDWQGAIEIYTQLIEGWPEDPYMHELYFARADAHAQLREYDQSIRDFTNAVEIDADFDEAYLQRAVAYGYLDQLDQVIQDCTTIIDQLSSPETMISAYRLRGLAYLNQEQYENAIRDFDSGLILQADHLEIIILLADAQFEVGQHELSLQTINHAIELAPDSTDALIELAYILNGINRTEEAKGVLMRALSINPELDIPEEIQHLKPAA